MATYVAVFALVLAYVAIVIGYCALRTLAKLRRASTVLARGSRGPGGQASLIEATARYAELTATVAEQLDSLRAHVDATEQAMREQVVENNDPAASALRHIALVRYDAFTEMSGRMSFSLAMLDDGGDGVTITAITGRTDTRVYAKAVARGQGEHDLSPEERQAITAALGTGRRGLRKAG